MKHIWLASGWYASYRNAVLLPPANVVCEGYIFTPVCQSFCSQRGHVWQGGMRGGGHAWWGDMHGRGWGVSGGGHVWWGACVAGGVCGGGACMADTMRYGQRAGGTHPTGMHSC